MAQGRIRYFHKRKNVKKIRMNSVKSINLFEMKKRIV